MIAYVDSSVLLRVVLRQRDALKEWRRLTQGVASALVEVECLRTLDRLRIYDVRDDGLKLARQVLVQQRDLSLPGDSAGFVWHRSSLRFTSRGPSGHNM